MFQEERLLQIMDYLKQHHRVSVQEIIDLFGVSRDTARRDIVKLEEQGAIVRTRGGAILPSVSKEFVNYKERLQFESEGKRAIGQYAASLIKDGEYVMLDASTTVQFAAESWQTQGNVVVTNSIDLASILTGHADLSIHLLGGRLNPEHRHVAGSQTITMLQDYQVDKLLLGVGGMTADGLYNPYEEDGFVKREMINRANQVIVLADHTKLGAKAFYRVAGLERIDILLTDAKPEGEIAEALQTHGIDVRVVNSTERGK